MNSEEPNASNSLAGGLLSGLLAAFAIIAAIVGMLTAFGYLPTKGTVGSDTFTIIIAGIRGLAWIASAIAAAVLALFIHLASRDQPRG